MKYTIETLEVKDTKTGKKFMRADLKDEQGNVTSKVSVWSDFPGFSTLTFGSEVEGEIKTKGDFKNLYPIMKNSVPWARKQTGLVEKKSEAVAMAMDRKEEGIRKSQDVNERIYAKFGAAQVVAHHPAFNDLGTPADVYNAIHRLANQIYHDELEAI